MRFYPIKFFLLILSCIGLFACSSTQPVAQQADITAKTQADLSVRAYVAHHPEVLQDLQASDIQLLQLGDYDRFVLPSAALFDGFGDRIQPSLYPALDQIIEIVKAIPKESITIKAYAFENSSDQVAIKLTALQAQAVADYLMSHGVDARLIYSIGMGNLNQVTASPDRLLENYRIEITLQELKTRLPG